MGNILIYGGCVMRDAFEYIPGHALNGYVARQSLLSACSPPTKLLGTADLESKFQKRSLQADLDSMLLRTIRARAETTDLLLIDLLSDRLGVFELEDGARITNSSELKQSGLMRGVNAKQIQFGTDRHFNLWKRAVARFTGILESTDMMGKALHIETPWAETTNTGEPSRPFRKMSATEGNALYARYYEHMRATGIRTARLPDELVVADSNHKWGPDPYHYTEPAYLWMRDQIQAALT